MGEVGVHEEMEVGVHAEMGDVVAVGLEGEVQVGVDLLVVCCFLQFDIASGSVLVRFDPDSASGIGYRIQLGLDSGVALLQIRR